MRDFTFFVIISLMMLSAFTIIFYMPLFEHMNGDNQTPRAAMCEKSAIEYVGFESEDIIVEPEESEVSGAISDTDFTVTIVDTFNSSETIQLHCEITHDPKEQDQTLITPSE